MKRYLSLFLTLLLLAGCSPSLSPTQPGSGSSSAPPPPPPPGDTSVTDPLPEPDPRQETIDALLSSMTREEKVGQLFFAHCPELSAAELAAEYHLGGYLLFRRDFKDKSVQQVQEAISSYQEASDIPMLIGADEEGGTVARVSGNPQIREKRFLSPQKLYQQGGLEAILADAVEKDALLLSLGVNVNFAPVADLSTNPKDFIYDRTLGLGAEETCKYISALVARMEEDGVGSVLKHFPGYGPNPDTHTGSALDERPLDQLRQLDFLPFQAGIQAAPGGTAAVLMSHNILQEADPDRPGSLSPALYRLLREELSFNGPVLTDDLGMEAITKYAGEDSPSALAITAGCDMAVTADFQKEIPRVLAALEDGSLPQERVDEAVTRVLGWKYDLGLISPTE